MKNIIETDEHKNKILTISKNTNKRIYSLEKEILKDSDINFIFNYIKLNFNKIKNERELLKKFEKRLSEDFYSSATYSIYVSKRKFDLFEEKCDNNDYELNSDKKKILINYYSTIKKTGRFISLENIFKDLFNYYLTYDSRFNDPVNFKKFQSKIFMPFIEYINRNKFKMGDKLLTFKIELISIRWLMNIRDEINTSSSFYLSNNDLLYTSLDLFFNNGEKQKYNIKDLISKEIFKLLKINKLFFKNSGEIVEIIKRFSSSKLYKESKYCKEKRNIEIEKLLMGEKDWIDWYRKVFTKDYE